ncbi:transcriptional regulator, XRE family with cupin sensor [Frankia torreyi]|uniref:Transcriptional regulator, XRE family with cupin sensor n=2 Tax=Frankia TaxID=1854 RepID=A0A0D8BF81_9ACTN|nr:MULTISPECIES: XRE family transcriptional regulator [Frankia]KJE22092.1 transcriptional regulator, XRE family with cupin sensor [Frankia torreyi]KQC38070.1 transcriptional regulator [Frankia sp. ACN1ag]
MTAFAEDVGVRLGGAVRAQRHALGLTLVDVAGRAGLSHPFLSQLERGLARPSMRSLTAIASALGTSAQALMAAAEASVPLVEPVSVVRHDTVSVDSPGGSVRSLVRGARAMLPSEYTGAPASFHDYFQHDGEEFVYVVSGCIEVDVDGVLHTVAAGESVYYAGGVRHRWRGLDGEQVRLVVVQQNA